MITDLEIKQLGIDIEQLREKLHCVVGRKGIKSSEAIRASQTLDNKINEYNDLKS